MAKAVTARRQGDEFQAIFFWKQLVNLLIDNTVKRVTFESDQRIFVDDVVVEYSEPMVDQQTGHRYRIDAYQCKYHVVRGTTFSIDKLIDPKFLKTKQSMLQRLYDAYQYYSKENELFRLHIVSSTGWDTIDPFCEFLSAENHVRSTFYEKGPISKQGKIRKKLAAHLGIQETELKEFLNLVRFDLGVNRKEITENLDTKLKNAGLLQLDKTITNTRYDELAWKWKEQGLNSFDKQSLEELVRSEKLIDIQGRSLLLIRHQSLDPIVPEVVRDDLPSNLRNLNSAEVAVDLTHLFSDGRLVNPRSAINEQLVLGNEILNWYKVNPNVELVYYGIAHIPLVFLLGYQLNARRRINIFEHNRENNHWNLLSTADTFPDLIVRNSTHDGVNNVGAAEAVIRFGVSYPILDVDVKQIVSRSLLTVDLTLPSPAPDSIRNISQLENYAREFRNTLDKIHNLDVGIERVHVFYSGPVCLAFRCGQLISPTIHPKVLIYNYFSRDVPRYKWGIHVNISPSSTEFLVEL